jgi:DNA-binding NarL/FixJ family response regulator
MPVQLDCLLIVHAGPQSRAEMRMLIECLEPLLVLGKAADGEVAVQICQTAVPAWVIWEAQPEAELIPCLTQFHEQYPESKIVLWGAAVSETYLPQLLNIGVVGYFGAEAKRALILSSLRAILNGAYCFEDDLIATWLAEQNNGRRPLPIQFTNRERQILNLIGLGMGNNEIASELNLASQTIRNYTNKLYAKLDVSNRTEAALWAQKHSLSSF